MQVEILPDSSHSVVSITSMLRGGTMARSRYPDHGREVFDSDQAAGTSIVSDLRLPAGLVLLSLYQKDLPLTRDAVMIACRVKELANS